ncbi:MAG: YkgJ family cysteine cluster protein [Campylobacterota bacterium]|nr:YkgJ family cysteine cluster protein [Campylobacterota bacterium]
MISQASFSYKFDETKCETCGGKCCIGESGYIWITPQEILKLSQNLKITQQELIDKYLIKYDYKYSIKEKIISDNNFACIFFDTIKMQCSVYDARPKQCRTFPFWEYFRNNIEELKEECPAIVN